MPATIAWLDSLDGTALMPLVALPVTLVVGLLLLPVRRTWRAGAHVLLATVLAAIVEVVATFALVLAYSASHSGWDLS